MNGKYAYPMRPPQWLAGLTSGVYWTMAQRQTPLSHILCRRFLNAFTDVAHTTSTDIYFFLNLMTTVWEDMIKN